MPIAIHMRGLLEPVIADETLSDSLTAMNMAASAGKEFMVVDGMDSDFIAIKMDNILTMREVEVDEPEEIYEDDDESFAT